MITDPEVLRRLKELEERVKFLEEKTPDTKIQVSHKCLFTEGPFFGIGQPYLCCKFCGKRRAC